MAKRPLLAGLPPKLGIWAAPDQPIAMERCRLALWFQPLLAVTHEVPATSLVGMPPGS